MTLNQFVVLLSIVLSACAAVANAIYNATGVRIFKIPVDQDALLLAMKRGQTEVHRAWQDVK